MLGYQRLTEVERHLNGRRINLPTLALHNLYATCMVSAEHAGHGKKAEKSEAEDTLADLACR